MPVTVVHWQSGGGWGSERHCSVNWNHIHTYVCVCSFSCVISDAKNTCSKWSNILLCRLQFPSPSPSQRENPNQWAANRERSLHKILLAGLRSSRGNQGRSKLETLLRVRVQCPPLFPTWHCDSCSSARLYDWFWSCTGLICNPDVLLGWSFDVWTVGADFVRACAALCTCPLCVGYLCCALSESQVELNELLERAWCSCEDTLPAVVLVLQE